MGQALSQPATHHQYPSGPSFWTTWPSFRWRWIAWRIRFRPS